MPYYSSSSGTGLADHPWIIIVAVVIGIIVCLCKIAASTADDDSAELPPVVIVAVPSPQHVYPNHVINVESGYVAMAATPSLNQAAPMAVQVTTLDGTTLPSEQALTSGTQVAKTTSSA